MKTYFAILSLGVLMAISANECRANFDGYDDFNDNSKDPAKWGTDVALSGVGFLTETNQRLEYTTSGAPTANDAVLRPWNLNMGNYSNDWEVFVDFNSPGLGLTNGQSAALNLIVMPDPGGTNWLVLSFVQDPDRALELSVGVDGQGTSVARVNTGATSATVRIAFDGSTKLLAGFFDEDGPNCGYSWKMLGTSVVPSAWGMTSNGLFNVVVAASSANTTVASSNNVFADNFKAASGSLPKPQIRHTGGGVEISWPTNAADFRLESAATLSLPICWNAVANATVIVGTNFTVTDPILNACKFYRLSRYGLGAAPADMVLIPAGSFAMGDAFGDGDSDERPVHTVEVSAFHIGRYEVSKALWDEVYQWATNHGYGFDNAGSAKAMNHPVQQTNWYDVVKWCNARSEKEGRTPAYYTNAAQTAVYRSGQVDLDNTWVNWTAGYRLPTEAEWEKAARGGASGHRFPWSNVDTISHSQANYYADTNFYAYDVSLTQGYHPTYNDGVEPYTSPVRSFAPNGYGLYDMAGNVSEWCWDWYGSSYYNSSPGSNPRGSETGSDRLIRGGGWDENARGCRSAFRNFYPPAEGYTVLGFRTILPSDGP